MPGAKSVDKTFTGAGPLDGAEDLASNVENAFVEGKKVDAAQLAIDGGGMILDTAGAIMDPLGTLASSAVGWVIENVGWVREPFDDLMGDPPAIEAVANTWGNISKHLGDTASQHRSSMSQVSDWQGQSGQAYHKTGANLFSHVENASAAAASAAQKIKNSRGGRRDHTRPGARSPRGTRRNFDHLGTRCVGELRGHGRGFRCRVRRSGGDQGRRDRRADRAVPEEAVHRSRRVGALAGSASNALLKRADDLTGITKSADSAAPGTGAQKLDNFTDAANTKADGLRQRADGFDQTAADKWAESKQVNHGTDMSAWGHDTPGTTAAESSDGPLGNTRFGQSVAKFDEVFNKSSLDGQSVVRGFFSGDLSGHLAPSAGDAVAVGKEYGKEYNKAFHQDEEEKPNEPVDRKQVGKYLTDGDSPQPHIVDDDKK